jgi:Mg-chelatase subunit ChlD
MIRHVQSRWWNRPAMVLLMACWGALAVGCGDSAPKLSVRPNRKDGTAVYLLLDVSGSMSESVSNTSGAMESKLGIAKRAAIDVCRAVAKYAGEDKTRTIRLGVASFSDDYQVTVGMGPPDADAAARAINGLATRGGTAIGNAVILAQKALDDTGLRNQHILVVTDGENNTGPKPGAVAAGINALPEALRPSVYVVAFDVKASLFDDVKAAGWQVFSAADGRQLAQQLDEVVGGHILIEK